MTLRAASLGGCLDWLSAVCLYKLDHLRDSFSGKDGQQIGYKKELMCFGACGSSGSELAKSDALAIIGATSTSVDKGRVVPVNIEMIVVNEETFTDSSVSIIESVHVESIKEPSLDLRNHFSKTYSSSSGRIWQLLEAMISLVSVKIADLLQSASF